MTKMLCCEHHVMAKFLDLLMEPLRVKPITMQLVRNLLFNQSCGIEEKTAYGMKSPDHVQALQMVIHAGLFDGDLLDIIKQLDAAAYQGTALSDLIAQHAPYYTHLAFEPLAAEPEYSDESIPF